MKGIFKNSGVRPCLKWPGGKQWISSRLVPILARELVATYREPFIGGGAVFFQMAPSRSVLSDVNGSLISFFSTLAKDPAGIVRIAERWKNNRASYYSVRSQRPSDDLAHAARFLYLNRTCWGGIFRTNRQGEFNVPFGDSGREVFCYDDLVACSSLLSKATLSVMDFQEAMGTAQAGDVIYADPPYTTRGENNGFVRYNEKLFSWADQVRLSVASRSASGRGVFVGVSGLWHKEVLQLYEGWWAWQIARSSRVSRNVHMRGIVHEVVVFSRKPKYRVVGDGPPIVKLTRKVISEACND